MLVFVLVCVECNFLSLQVDSANGSGNGSEGGGGGGNVSVSINCINLHEQLQLTWTLNMTAPQPMATFTLCGRLETNQYMAFGLSGSPDSINMVNGDVTVAWVDSEPHAEDYFLERRQSVCTIGT